MTPATWSNAAPGEPTGGIGGKLPPALPIDLRARWLLGWGVAPAVVATPIYERFVPADKLEETLHSFDGFHPLGRTGTGRDLANTITFLLSPATSWSPAPSGTSTAGRN